MVKDQLQSPGEVIQASQASFNAKEFLFKYVHYGWLFILAMVLSIVVAWVYLRYTPPTYSATSTLLIRSDNAGRGGGAGSGGQNMFADIELFQSNSNKQNEMLILSSRSMMERVVKSLSLQMRYFIVGNVKSTDVYPNRPLKLEVVRYTDSLNAFNIKVHFSDDWKTFRLGESKKEWQMGEAVELPEATIRILKGDGSYDQHPSKEFQIQWMPSYSAANIFVRGLQVLPANDLSNVLSLTYTSENPKLASAILNQLVIQYNDITIEDKNEINRKILAFINDRLGLVERQLDSVEGNLQQFRTSQHIIDLAAQSEINFSNINELGENLRLQEVQLQVIELLEQYVSQPANKGMLVPSTLGITDPTLLELTGGYNKLVLDRNLELQTGATVNNPVIKNFDKNIEDTRIKMLQNLANIKAVYRNAIQVLKRQSGIIKKEISSVPEKERRARERARQQEVKQNLYLYLMQKREEAEIAKASTISNSRIIDAAVPLYKKVGPISLKIYGIALAIGLILPIVIIYILDLLNDKVITREDIAKVTHAPMLGEIGHSEEEKVLLFPERSRTIPAEQVRILRSNLKFMLGDLAEKPTLLVTSSGSGEGKSFVSTNLGAAMAISGKRAIILEFDLRKPKILEGLGLPKSQGLTNYLVGNTELEDLPQRVPQIEGLYVISCGPVPPNPSEILLSPKIAELFKWLKQNFDAIVIDSAPVGLVSDSFTLSQYSDCTIYVIRQRYTFKRQLSFINDLYVNHKLPHMGLLVNDVIAVGTKGYYGYGGAYGYGYGRSRYNGYYEIDTAGKFKKLWNNWRRK